MDEEDVPLPGVTVICVSDLVAEKSFITNTDYEQICQYLDPRILRFGIRFSF